MVSEHFEQQPSELSLCLFSSRDAVLSVSMLLHSIQYVPPVVVFSKIDTYPVISCDISKCDMLTFKVSCALIIQSLHFDVW